MQCGADGKWDKPFQFCSTKGTCPAPVNINTGLTVISCGENRRPGEECQITCGEGLRPIVEVRYYYFMRSRSKSIAGVGAEKCFNSRNFLHAAFFVPEKMPHFKTMSKKM